MAKKNYVSVDLDFLENSIANLKNINILGLITADQGDSYAFNGSPQEVATSADHIIATEDSVWIKTDTRTANTVLAGPASGNNAAATFRSLVAADIPSIPSSKISDLSSVLSSYLPLAGGTMTGAINWANNAGIVGTSGNLLIQSNQSAGMIVFSSDNDLYHRISVDDETDPYYVYKVLDTHNTTLSKSNNVLTITLPDATGTATSYTAVDENYVSGALSTALADYTPTANFAKLTVYSGNGVGDTNVLEYTPTGAANLYIEYDKNGAVELTANGTTHKITVNHKTQGPSTSGNTTISDSTGKVLSAITVNKFGHVTSVAQKTLAAADIPNIAISQVTNLQTSLDAKADDTDLNNYLDLAGTHIMTGPLQWDNHSIHPDNNAGFFFDIGTNILMTSDSGEGEIKLDAIEYYFNNGNIYHTVSGNDYELIDEHNFPTLWGNAYNANGINGALTFGVNTGSPTTTAHLEVVRVNGVDYLHSRLPFYSDGDVSGFGANGSGGGSGSGGKIQTVYTTSDFGTIAVGDSHQAYETETFNAYAVDTLYNRLVTAEGDIDSLETAIGSLVGFEARVVNSLPLTGDVGIIYLVSHNHGTGDVYDEYIWVSSTSSYEKIGNTDIDLSQYINSVDFASGSSAGTGKAITNFTKSNNSLTFTTGTFLTSHQSLDGYVNALSGSTSGGQYVSSISKSGKTITVTYTNLSSVVSFGTDGTTSRPITIGETTETFLKSITSSDVTGALGYTPVNPSDIKSLKIYGGANGTTSDTKVIEYSPSTAKTLYITKGNAGISVSGDATNTKISISHATGGANTTISAANKKVLSAITVNSYGHVTSVSSKDLAAADIPDISGTYLTVDAASSTYQPLDADLTAIAGLTGTSGLLKKTAANTWTLDTNTYLTTGTAATTYQPLDSDLTAIAGISSGEGVLVRSVSNSTVSWSISANYMHSLVESKSTGDNYVSSISYDTTAGALTVNYGTLPTTIALANVTDADDLKLIEALTGTGTPTRSVSGNTVTWSLESYQPYSGMLVSFAALGNNSNAGLIHKDSTGNLTLKSTSSIASFGTEGDDYVPISLNGTSKNVLTQHQDLSAYLQKSALNIIDAGTGEYVSGISWDSSSAALSVSRGSLSGYLTTSAAASTYLSKTDAASTYQPLDADLTAIAGLTGTSGFLKKTAANTWSLDTSTYLTTSAASSTYLPLAGGTMANATTATIKWAQNTWNTTNGWDTWNGQSNTGLAVLTSSVTGSGAPSRYAVGLHVGGYYGMQIAVNTNGNMYYRYTKTTPDAWKQLLTTTSASNTYLPLVGGTLTGPLHVKTTGNNILNNTDGYIDFTDGSSTVYAKMGGGTGGGFGLYASSSIYLRPNDTTGTLSTNYGVTITPTAFTYNGSPVIKEKQYYNESTAQTGYIKVSINKAATYRFSITCKRGTHNASGTASVGDSIFSLRGHHFSGNAGWKSCSAYGITGSSNTTIKYGYDATDNIWFAIPINNGDRPGLLICNVESGVLTIDDFNITWVTTLTGTESGETKAYTLLNYGVAGYTSRTIFSPTNGALYTTETTCPGSKQRYINIRIEGRLNGDYSPILTLIQAYWNGSSFSITRATNLGYELEAVTIGKLATTEYFFVWIQGSANRTYYVTINTSDYTYGKNLVTGVSDAAVPSDATATVSITPKDNFLRVNTSGYVESPLTVYTSTSGSPSLWLQRGTTSDNYVDYGIRNISGVLTFQYRTSSNVTIAEMYRNSTLSENQLRIVCATYTEKPTLYLVRGTVADSYTDWKVQNDGGYLKFINSVSGTDTEIVQMSGTGLYPCTTSGMSLGLSTKEWSNIYSAVATISGDATIGGNETVTGILTVGASGDLTSSYIYTPLTLGGDLYTSRNIYITDSTKKIEFYGNAGNGSISYDGTTATLKTSKLNVTGNFSVGSSGTPVTSIDLYGPTNIHGDLTTEDIYVPQGKSIKFAKSGSGYVTMSCDNGGNLYVDGNLVASGDVAGFGSASSGTTQLANVVYLTSESQLPATPDANTIYLILES